MWLDKWRPKYTEFFVMDLALTFNTNQVKLQANHLLVSSATLVLVTVITPLLPAVMVEQIVAISRPIALTAIRQLAMRITPA
jgi:hypothetical protein